MARPKCASNVFQSLELSYVLITWIETLSLTLSHIVYKPQNQPIEQLSCSPCNLLFTLDLLFERVQTTPYGSLSDIKFGAVAGEL